MELTWVIIARYASKSEMAFYNPLASDHGLKSLVKSLPVCICLRDVLFFVYATTVVACAPDFLDKSLCFVYTKVVILKLNFRTVAAYAKCFFLKGTSKGKLNLMNKKSFSTIICAASCLRLLATHLLKTLGPCHCWKPVLQRSLGNLHLEGLVTVLCVFSAMWPCVFMRTQLHYQLVAQLIPMF